jgi:myo-inositol-1(or 4)-monophosphatase
MRIRTPSPALRLDLAAARREAVAAAEAAGALLSARIAEPFAIHAKGTAGDIVTELDIASESLILERLRTAYPGHRIIAEESGAAGPADSDLVWLVDPLDGSNNIAVGLAVYAVGLALCEKSIPVLGVVHDPVTGRTWSAIRGNGAWDRDGSRLRLGERANRADNPVLAWIQGHDVGPADPIARALRSALEVRAQRVLQLWAPLVQWTMLARGDIDGIVGYLPELVDLPAGVLLAIEAGAEIRALDGGPYEMNIDLPPADRGFVAARPGQVDRLLEVTADALSG